MSRCSQTCIPLLSSRSGSVHAASQSTHAAVYLQQSGVYLESRASLDCSGRQEARLQLYIILASARYQLRQMSGSLPPLRNSCPTCNIDNNMQRSMHYPDDACWMVLRLCKRQALQETGMRVVDNPNAGY